MERIRARYVVLSSNVELRLDGQPRAGLRDPADPGVALYFQLDGKLIVLACDRYTTVAANMAAIAAHLDATRTIERHGVGTLEQMFAGFAALPAPGKQPWRAVLGYKVDQAVTREMVQPGGGSWPGRIISTPAAPAAAWRRSTRRPTRRWRITPLAEQPRLLDRAELRVYLGGLPWAEVSARIERGKLPRPLWRLELNDKHARWDRRAIDRALDAESAIPASLEAQEQALDRALGFA